MKWNKITINKKTERLAAYFAGSYFKSTCSIPEKVNQTNLKAFKIIYYISQALRIPTTHECMPDLPNTVISLIVLEHAQDKLK